jgi:hypothetical protein
MTDTLRLVGFAVGVRFTRLSIRLVGFASTVNFLRRFSRPDPHDPIPPQAVARLSTSVARVSESPYHASCLDRSLFLWFLLRRRGLDGTLRIGVAFDDDDLVGHAWVELGGTVVNDDPDVADHFAVFDSDPTGIVFT